jgi:hypothetical protein
MSDYKKMYLILFRETTKAISALQKAQQETEELYMMDDNGGEENLIVLDINSTDRQ